MATINIYLTDQEEVKIKKLALAEGKSISKYCRERITEEKEEAESLSRVTIEYHIDQLEKRLASTEKNLFNLSKELLKQSRLNSNLSLAFIHLAMDDKKQKYEIYNEAEQEAEEYISKIFGEEKKK